MDVLLPGVASWFQSRFDQPTPPQQLGWPAIARGENTLILAPTGSGKTLAAFLPCLDQLWRQPAPSKQERGVRILYISPLKALNYDMARNLKAPLADLHDFSAREDQPLRRLSVALRTGDSTPEERRGLVSTPPDVLITTPESLHLMLTSRTRSILTNVSHVIVDEIHALCPNKRGVFLALLLERLQAINSREFVRVGLSATQKPLDEVARYLGGLRWEAASNGRRELVSRPVTIIDTGQRKTLDLQVAIPVERFGPQPEKSVWPGIVRRLLGWIGEHRSTLVFVNNRRVVERLTHELNEATVPEDENEGEAQSPTASIARSHHGSLSQEERKATEEALKRGDLPAVVATASLELGIDMGAVDLVCQVESPGSVSRALQRVGRAGHVVGQSSKGRLLAKTANDLLEAAALTRAMLDGDVESLSVPTNCLDLLAQQVIACVAVKPCGVTELFDLLRQAYPYRNLTAEAFESVLELVSGRFPAPSLRDLRARISWDRVNHHLLALPGTAQHALVGGGAIPETGTYPVQLGDGGPKLGELDEEFVLERRVGDVFVLGTSAWVIESIEPQRVLVARAEGRDALLPFWRGERAGRSPELGKAVGRLARLVRERLDDPELVGWLEAHYRMEPDAARALVDFIRRQQGEGDVVPDDRTILVESFIDPVGETGLAVLSPMGGKLHQALKLVLTARLRRRWGLSSASMHDDGGVLFRLPATDHPPIDLLENLSVAEAEELIHEELVDSALFGLRFRQNAGRALLMPRPDPSKRSPLWLQRLRAKDLLQVVRQFPNFPVVVETYRQCLEEDLDLPHLRSLLDAVCKGEIRVVSRSRESASPFVSALLLKFQTFYLYEWDEPRSPSSSRERLPAVDPGLLSPLLDREGWLNPGAVVRVDHRLRGLDRPPRDREEMAELLRRSGDLSRAELIGPMAGFLAELQCQGRAVWLELPDRSSEGLWISEESQELYHRAFQNTPDLLAVTQILKHYLSTRALVGLEDFRARYPVEPALAREILEQAVAEGELARTSDASGQEPRWGDPRNLSEARRLTIALARKESLAISPEAFTDWLLRHQHLHPSTRLDGVEGVDRVMEMFQGYAAAPSFWEAELFARRVRGYRSSWLDEMLDTGLWSWGALGQDPSEPLVAFLTRDHLLDLPREPWAEDDAEGTPDSVEIQVLRLLRSRGASFSRDLAAELNVAAPRVRDALRSLTLRGWVVNDRFDPIRSSHWNQAEPVTSIASSGRVGRGRLGPRARSTMLEATAEGRWCHVQAGLQRTESSGEEEAAMAWAEVLLNRHGVLTRETARQDAWSPSWKILAASLDRAEWRGEVRRGFFVEGLSGIQYSWPETADELARLSNATSDRGAGDAILLAAADPANLYGAGGAWDIPLLEGGTARLHRATGSFLVFQGGRPTLIIEGNGRRLTGLASASAEDLRAACALLPTLMPPQRRVLKIETYNGLPALASPCAEVLQEIGFVRDYPGMAYYGTE